MLTGTLDGHEVEDKLMSNPLDVDIWTPSARR